MLAALVGLACLYELFAPKSFLRSSARLVVPWAGVAAPARVSIEGLSLQWLPPEAADTPGLGRPLEMDLNGNQVTVIRGRQIVVSATINGLKSNEKPSVSVIPSDDGDRWMVEMIRGKGQAEFQAFIPGLGRGVDQPISILVEAGDARTEPIQVRVIDVPTLLVRSVEYHYPPYTGRENEIVEWQGDLRGIEGTTVTIIAESNQSLERAWLDFDCDGRNDKPMSIDIRDRTRATLNRVLLEMNADRSQSKHASYRLVFVSENESGQDVRNKEKLLPKNSSIASK